METGISPTASTTETLVTFDKDFTDFKGVLRKDTVNLKLDMIKQVGQGFSLVEIVQSLHEKYKRSKRTIYYHYSTLDAWTQYFLTVKQSKHAYLTALIRLDYIYREFSFIHQTSKDNCSKLGALKGMLFTLKEKADLTGISIKRKGDETEVSWKLDSTDNEILMVLKKYDDLIKAEASRRISIEVIDPDDVPIDAYSPEEK